MIEYPKHLTPDGQRRREQILCIAIREASQQRYARIERRLGTALLVVFVVTGMLLVKNGPVVKRRGDEIAARTTNRVEEAKTGMQKRPADERIQIVQTDPNILGRLSVPLQLPRWKVVGDDELLATLQQAGQPAGLIEINGRTQIVFR